MKASRRSLAAASVALAGLAVAAAFVARARAPKTEQERWSREAEATRIVRDDWGIAHVHGKTDADAVFGMIYAQAEDDFDRIETNYLNAMGRLAEAEGESAIFQDLRMKLFVDPQQLQALYAASPEWLRRLMDAWADGLNFFLRSHPGVRPRVIQRFEPWMALSFTEGSIGGDIEDVPLDVLEAFYGAPGDSHAPAAVTDAGPVEPGGSNGIAIAPSKTADHHALLLINPHTSFFFRSELQVTSDEGLNVYGAATWGQFFVYQGFNERVGWMHTSSGVDNVDFFEETIVKKDGATFYRYGPELRPVATSIIRVPFRDKAGAQRERTFTVFRTHHGPVVGQKDGRWLSVGLMQKPVEALSQSLLLTRATTYAQFVKAMELRANSSNNTVYADADGHVAYLHPQFIPRRDDRFDYTRPVDGADPATDWQGLHALDEAPHVLDPPTGWIMNTNDWPYSAAGPDSPKRQDFPRYMDVAGENPRGVHATMLLSGGKDFTADSLGTLAFDPYLPAFARLVPQLVHDHDALADASPLRATLEDPVRTLGQWDYRWSATSVATTLAVLWGDEIRARFHGDPDAGRLTVYDMADRTGAEQRLAALATVCDRLTRDFGSWRVPWGDFNRYQRLTADPVPHFSDAAPSIPVPFTAGTWGSLASFAARRHDGTAKYYGTSGNSFVAIVELGDRGSGRTVSARAVSIGGESGDPGSAHFADQSSRYAAGALRKVYFYPEELQGHVERDYHPR
jgi:acyl-homoserine-lactone acylase